MLDPLEPFFINNRYKAISKLGQGGMGIIYLVKDILKDNMLFALKTIKHRVLNKYNNLSIKSFRNEYEIMARLKHPNLTQVYDFGEDRGNLFILMEYLRGKLLSALRPEKTEQLIGIIVQILRTLEYVHSRNIIYRDIKPDNIMVCGNSIKLLDFGLSGFVMQKEETVKGTLSYIPPEILYGRSGFYSDIFSLGITFFELITKERFYQRLRLNPKGILDLLKHYHHYQRFQNDNLTMIQDAGLKQIIKKMTSYHAKDRYVNCSEIIGDINEKLKYNFPLETKESRESYILGNIFANRTSELNELKNYHSLRNKNNFVVYSGPVGIGKTRLFYEFKKYCRLNNIHFFETNCIEGKLRNYRSIGEIVSQMILFSSDELLARFGKYLRLILPEAGRLLSFKPPLIQDNPKLLQDIIVQNISDFIIAFSKETDRDIIIYFNDLHWLDEGSLYTIENLLYRLDLEKDFCLNLFIYANINEILLKDDHKLPILLDREQTKIYNLPPLDVGGVNQYMENVFGIRFLDVSLKKSAKLIRERVGGNPLVLGELIRSLIDVGMITKDKAGWKLLKPIDDLPVPQNIMDIITKKLEKIFEDKNRKKILQVLSLLRIDPDIETLKSIIAKIAVSDPVDILQELENMEVIQGIRIGNTIHYSYCSSLIKEEIFKCIENKAEISLILANTLESISEMDDYAEEIAFHYMQGNNTDKAVIYYIKCGDIAKNHYFNDNALKYYKNALRLAVKNEDKNMERKIEIMLKIGIILDLKGELEKSDILYRECIKTSKIINSRRLLADSYFRQGRIKFIRGKFSEALMHYDYSGKLYEEICHKQGIANVESYKGHLFTRSGEYTKALECYKKSRQISEDIGNTRNIGASTGNMGSIYFKLNQYEKALECHLLYRKISEGMGYKEGIAGATGNMGNIYYETGEYLKALECHEKQQSISEDAGNKQGIGIALSNKGVVYEALGNYDKALVCYEKGRKIFREIGHKYGIGITTANIGQIYLSLGEFPKALEYFSIYKKISLDSGDKLGTAIAEMFTGSVYSELEDFSNALNCFEKSIINFRKLKIHNSEFINCLLKRSHILLNMNDITEASVTNEEALNTANEIKHPALILRAEMQKHIISAVYDKEASLNSLKELLERDIDKESEADIYYELYIMTKEEKFKIKASSLYRSLYDKIPKHHYKKRIEELHQTMNQDQREK